MKVCFVNQIERIGNTQHIVTVKMIFMHKLAKIVKKCNNQLEADYFLEKILSGHGILLNNKN